MGAAISIVSGTYNRLPQLQRMVTSARRSCPLPLEFVLVDGGSTDGTLDWAREQPDVKLIEHGRLIGAIRAFNDGAFAASAPYIVMANDDIEFLPGGLLRAFAHLEDTPDAGAVAFQDNRPARGKANFDGGYGVQLIDAYPRALPYAQVGMFRRWLGNICGWWGADDPVMRHARTYGGDNYLSARIWELGYRVDVVRGVAIYDDIHPDALREFNLVEERKLGDSPYYKRYPRGPVVPPQPLILPRDEARLRVLYLPIYEPGWQHVQKANKRGLREALQRVGHVVEVDYLNEPFDLPRLVSTFRPDLLLMQVHSPGTITPAMLAEARKVHPGMVVVNWCGDVWEDCYLGQGMVDLLAHVDLQTGVNIQALNTYRKRTGKPTAYWQVAFEPAEDIPATGDEDIVFLANNYSAARAELGKLLADFGATLVGSGWENGAQSTLYKFQHGRNLYRKAKLAIGDNQYSGAVAFVSNRMFEALAAGGALYLQQRIEGLWECTGLKDGEHYIAWTDLDDLREKLKHWLDPAHALARQRIAKAGAAYVREHHSFDARVRELLTELIPDLVGEHREPVAV
jgi:glycosyltransferase involved in cell wall biosynthesis